MLDMYVSGFCKIDLFLDKSTVKNYTSIKDNLKPLDCYYKKRKRLPVMK